MIAVVILLIVQESGGDEVDDVDAELLLLFSVDEIAHRDATDPTSLGESPTPRRTSLLEELVARMACTAGRIDASNVVRSDADNDADDTYDDDEFLKSAPIRTPVVDATDPPYSECEDTKLDAKA